MSHSTDSRPKGSFWRGFGFLLLVTVLTIIAFLGSDLWLGDFFARLWFKGSHAYAVIGWIAPLTLVLIGALTWRTRERTLSREYDAASEAAAAPEAAAAELVAPADKD